MNERDMSLLKAVSEAVKEQLSAVQQRYETALSAQAEEINRLKSLVEQYQLSVPDEQAIVDLVLAKIEVPAAPVLPDIELMVKDAVAEIPVPELPVLPDIDGMIQRAVSAIKVPQPEPLPDIAKMVKDAVAEIPSPVAPEQPALPDIGKMVRDAVADIELPKPEPFPDIEKMVKEAVSQIPKARDGEDGEDGKDALQLEIMPEIVPEKSYPRGSYAIHSGGLWRSFQKTTGMNGWECLVDGISDIDITQAGERQFTVTAVKSSGEKTEKTFSVPVMIYRDIFKDGEKYYPGDSVTWGGSIWYCHQETGDKPGEDGSKGWKLAVKRGSDARAK
ncbi:MAG: phage gp6-like head-tail connector protein [Pantoea sp.]|uniref:phage gp6-like head-tail connector protein n=1 Tax=Pantoea TaxID=53335 RepID=UPI0028AF83EC|nr:MULTISPECIES: phage gp6-like head-tail connector protein [Pantoea]MDU1575421.1 phage gp6-like head-tail connector protein [Pantoea sp.]